MGGGGGGELVDGVDALLGLIAFAVFYPVNPNGRYPRDENHLQQGPLSVSLSISRYMLHGGVNNVPSSALSSLSAT